MLEVLRMISSPVYAVNTVLTEKRELSFISFGDIEESHIKSVEYAQFYSVIPSPQKYKTVVTCCAGYPLDQSYYQVRLSFGANCQPLTNNLMWSALHGRL